MCFLLLLMILKHGAQFGAFLQGCWCEFKKTDPSNLHQHVSVLTSKSEVVEDELLIYDVDDSREDHRSSTKLTARTFALNGIVEILSRWRTLDDHMKGTLSMEGCYVNEGEVDKMLYYCYKYTNK